MLLQGLCKQSWLETGVCKMMIVPQVLSRVIFRKFLGLDFKRLRSLSYTRCLRQS